MNNRMVSSELKVGIMILIGILILFYMSFRIGKYGVFSEHGYELTAVFINAGGLDVKTPVKIAGVEAGKIKKISLDGFKALITLTIRGSVRIPVDSRISIRSQGILGDKFLEITPGNDQKILAQGGKIQDVVEAPDFDQLFASVNGAAKNFGETMGELKGIISEKEKANIRKSIENFQEASGDFKNLIKENKGNISRVVSNVDETMSGLKLMVKDVESGKGTLGLLVKDETLYNDAREAVNVLKTISAEIDQGKGTLGKLVKDEALYDETKATIANIKDLTDGIKKGEGTLGRLAKDDSLFIETEKAAKKVQKAAEGIQEMTPVTILGTIFGMFF
ncbi:MAG: MlaD family protein [Proteobacteria bacterium]|nr:MlaD family protein [Pseudomonadota bacterium]